MRQLPAFDVSLVRETGVCPAIAQLDHDPTNKQAGNLQALCQPCHMIHEAREDNRQRLMTLHRRKALGDLFTGPYIQPTAF